MLEAITFQIIVKSEVIWNCIIALLKWLTSALDKPKRIDMSKTNQPTNQPAENLKFMIVFFLFCFRNLKLENQRLLIKCAAYCVAICNFGNKHTLPNGLHKDTVWTQKKDARPHSMFKKCRVEWMRADIIFFSQHLLTWRCYKSDKKKWKQESMYNSKKKSHFSYFDKKRGSVNRMKSFD